MIRDLLRKGKWKDWAVKNGRVRKAVLKWCWIAFALGCLWVLAFPRLTITTGELKCRNTYIDENALLVDTSTPYCSETQAHWAKSYHRQYASLDFDEVNEYGCSMNCSKVIEWIDKQLNEINDIEVYHQTFQEHLFDQEYVNRTNIYAILRASPLADHKESIVLVTHYTNIPTTNKNGYSSLSLSIALLKHLTSAKWLAKDIILLITDDGPSDGKDGYAPGVQAWLEAYHNDPLRYADAKVNPYNAALPMHAGIIQAAINIETSADLKKFNSIGLLSAGLNGQLPNLDLVNSAVQALENEHIPILLDRCGDFTVYCNSIFNLNTIMKYVERNIIPTNYHSQFQLYLQDLSNMFQFMKSTAFSPSGPHANFIRFNIDAISLSAVYSEVKIIDSKLKPEQFLRALETLLRALSNLDEKLHQSYYFYMLPTTKTFVSIGEYYYSLVLILIPLLAHLLYLLYNTAGLRTACTFIIVLSAEIAGIVLYYVSNHLSLLDPIVPLLDLTKYHPDTLSRSYCWTFIGIVVSVQFLMAFIVFPFINTLNILEGCVNEKEWIQRMEHHEFEMENIKALKNEKIQLDTEFSIEKYGHDCGWKSLKIALCIFIILAHCTLGIINYPLAIVFSIPMVYFSFIIPAYKASYMTNIFNGTYLFMTSPPVFLALLQYFNPNILDALAYAIHNSSRMGLLMMPYLCMIYFPVHTWSIYIWKFKRMKTT